MLHRVFVGKVEVTIRDKGKPFKSVVIKSEDLPELSFTSTEDKNVLWFDGEKLCYLYIVPRVAVSFYVETEDGVRIALLATSSEVNEPLWRELAQLGEQKKIVEYVAQNARKFSSEKEALKELINFLKERKK